LADEGNRLRLFVAATVPHELLQSVADEMQPFRSRFPHARWTDVDNQHVTLKFLGWVGGEALGSVTSACASVASAHAPAPLALGELGAFPSRTRVRVVWVGLDDPAHLLERCSGALDDTLQPLGFDPEKRAFTPHLTLARLREAARPAGEWPRPGFPSESWTCDELTLFRSHLSPRGARYEPLSTFPLTGSASNPLDGAHR
jgi:2'-5' RNA ligase